MNENAKPSMDLSFLGSRTSQKRIIAISLAGAIVGAAIGLLSEKWYRSSVTVVPAGGSKNSGISGLLGSDLGAVAAGLGAGGGSTDVTRIAAVLQSQAVSDAVIEKFDLKKRYRAAVQESARDALWTHCIVTPLPKPNLVQLSCEDTDPKFAQEMVSYFAEIGNQVFRRVSVSSASEEVRFLEQRAAQLQVQADMAAAKMREFQERHRIVDLDAQAKAVVSTFAALNSQRTAKSMDLRYARGFSSSDEAGTLQMESQLSVLDEKLKALEGSPPASGGPPVARAETSPKSSGMVPVASDVPRLRAELEALFRDRKVAEATLVYVRERLEGAKASEAREMSTFHVLDPPTVPTRKSRPSPRVNLIFGAALGLMLGTVFEFWRSNPGLRRFFSVAREG